MHNQPHYYFSHWEIMVFKLRGILILKKKKKNREKELKRKRRDFGNDLNLKNN